MNPHRISLARTLPILALLLSYVIIAVPATTTYVGLERTSDQNGNVIISRPQYRLRVRHDQFLRYSLVHSAFATSHAIQAINFPARFVEYGVDLSTRTWPQRWSPRGIYPMLWQAITFPIYCLPFWWFVGLGLDGVIARRWFRLWVLSAGSLLWFFWSSFLVYFVAVGVNSLPVEDRGITFILCGLILWTGLLSSFPIAGLRQALILRRIKTSLQARLSQSCNNNYNPGNA